MNRKPINIAKQLFPRRIKSGLQQTAWRSLRLEWPLHSGLTARISGRSDWYIFNEIFVDGDYDSAIAMALGSAGQHPIQVLDLGANVGLFTLRLVHQLRAECKGGFHIIAVEGNPKTAETLRRRMAENQLAQQVRVFHGLIGERSGLGTITDLELCGNNTVCSQEASEGVPYLNLSTICAELPTIDLLKCDIEGSELTFIRNYPDVLAKVRVAVFELHPKLCDDHQCEELLKTYGFMQSRVLTIKDAVKLVLFWREPETK